MKTLVWFLFGALALAGCVSEKVSPLSEMHPANPQAPQSSEPIATPMLMAGSQGLVLPVSTNQTEIHHGEHPHMPSGKSDQPPGEHKHGQAQKKETPAQGAVYTCPHHAEVKQNKPGECPKCGMKLEIKK
ncbi:MAG: hypothetical protein L0Y58_15945 [Verrucomicrobia subdivision 3 bacterium]|nr:hypothetical protein [Limisphaerales bacterium]